MGFHFMTIYKSSKCGYSSVVERHLAKVNVARSNRVTRLKTSNVRIQNQLKPCGFLSLSTNYWSLALVRTNPINAKTVLKLKSFSISSN